jgi:energy-coupling factor transporter ATP-binding protein EcfA2
MSLVQFPASPWRALHGATELAEAPSRAALPRAPQTIDDTGLSINFLSELVAKTMFQLGLTRLTDLSGQLCLGSAVVESVCQFMRRETLLEVTRRGQHEADVQFDLTQAGRARAADWLARNSYVGAAPVPLDAYTDQVTAQSVVNQAVTAQQVRAAFADMVVPQHLLDLLGTAVNSARPMLLHGPSGSGKTFLAQHLQRIVTGPIAIPHAIAVHGEVIRVYDPQCHRLLPVDAAPRAALDNRARPDSRWLWCERPCVVSGGELTLEMLDLSFDSRAGYYEAPPHFKANNGLFIVDDLGRQVITPRQLMNRWVVPMERRHDHLMLRNGGKFTIPFDMVLVFSSNLRPDQLEDAAFLRRLGHKIAIEPLPLSDYAQVFERACQAEGVPHEPAALQRLVNDFHLPQQRPLLACYPRDLLHLISSRARYLGVAAELSPELLDWAWHAYFGNEALNESVPHTGSSA